MPSGIFDDYFAEFNKIVEDELEIVIHFYLPPIYTECVNCISENFGGKITSTGVYKDGGPLPFENTICPVCSGEGASLKDGYEIGRGRAYFNTSELKEKFVNVPNAEMMLLVKAEHYSKIKNCIYCIPQNGMQDLEEYKFKILKQPIITNFSMNPVKYVESFWGRNVT